LPITAIVFAPEVASEATVTVEENAIAEVGVKVIVTFIVPPFAATVPERVPV
jgi:hypothetical protein